MDNDVIMDTSDVPAPFDEISLKRMILQFERKVLKNQEHRIKYSNDALKFMETEVELFEIIKKLQVTSTQPELYHVLIELKVLTTLIGLLVHENTDISCAVVSLLQELGDVDDSDDYEKVSILLDSLIESQIIQQLVFNMTRLDESVKEESEGVYNSLAIIENLLDYKPELSKDCQSLLSWLLQRMKAKLPFDGNKLYASEILCILLQNNDENRKQLGSLGGIDTLLQQIAYFKRHDVSSADEREYLENVFDCLCSALLCCSSNRKLFFDGEGIELMNLILKEKKKGTSGSLRMGTVKVLNHLLSEDKGRDSVLEDCCNKFIEIFGLASIFPIFLKPKSITLGQKKKEANVVIDDVEEHCCSIILALLKHSKVENKRRVLNKFLENNMEKTERLVELHFKYADRLIRCDSLIRKERAQKMANDENIDEEQIFIRRLTEGGLFTLQIVEQIILIICQEPSSKSENNQPSTSTSTSHQQPQQPKDQSIKGTVIKLLNIHASSSVNHYKLIKSVMKEMAEEQDNDEKERILQLVEEF
ncbi:beta-catenin-like protein 1 [Panonychus citri]|uniref:beta-catenin-like protein 1 n=1 Tax=Panonychus citri TaxID=50023 RepID=UPI0023079E90|nr:beta-catenin-like protein 1 [Panonychus citri]XP_053205320.1 beta-catenin-like protein 1 [Panonychus citri]